MLDINDFIVEKGGDPKKIIESQRRRFADPKAVGDVIEAFQDARKGGTSSETTCDIVLILVNSSLCGCYEEKGNQ